LLSVNIHPHADGGFETGGAIICHAKALDKTDDSSAGIVQGEHLYVWSMSSKCQNKVGIDAKHIRDALTRRWIRHPFAT